MSRPIRVAMLDPSNFSMPYDHWLCEALVGEGAQVTLYGSPCEWPYERNYRFEPIFYPLANRYGQRWSHGKKRILKGAEHIAESLRNARRILEGEPDIVHFQWTPLPEFDARWMRSFTRRGVPLAYTAHNLLPHDSPASAAKTFAKIYAVPDGIVVHHANQIEEMQRLFGLNAQRLFTAPIGHFGHVERFRGGGKLPEAWSDIDRSRPTILFFGNIHPYKGLDTLLEAFAKAAERVEGLQLLIAGKPGGPWEPYAERIEALGLAQRTRLWLEYVGEESIADLFDLAHAVALPYRRIDQSAVAMTALGLGKAMIGSDVGGFGEIIRNGVNGYLTPPGEAQPLADALADLFSQPERPEKFGGASLEIARKEYAWEPIARKTIEMYRRLIPAQR